MKIGPFFYIRNKLIYNAVSLEEGRHQADKLDNSFGHDRLYDEHFRYGDYIDYPRGRVVWDLTNERAIIYIDPCVNTASVIKQVIEAFCLDYYVIRYDDHYHCKNCVGDLFE